MTEEQKRDLADYMLDHYGTCADGGDCMCLRSTEHPERRAVRWFLDDPWPARRCPKWAPAGFTSWNGMREALSSPVRGRAA